MKACILYYSGSGNTRLACKYITGKAAAIKFDLIDMLKDPVPDLGAYDLVGFAAFADYLGPSKFFGDYLRKLPAQTGKPAFVFSTFGKFNGATLRLMAEQANARGFKVIAGHALHMPENVPTMIVSGNANLQAPDEAELAAFGRFIRQLDDLAAGLTASDMPGFKLPLRAHLIPSLPRTIGRKSMGLKMVDEALCTRCSICAGVCPYGAVTMDGLPRFDQQKCYGCWACYNHCPAKAIYTNKYRGVGHYPEPVEPLKKKLSV
jgi:ferredoxin/flavodoxin